MSYLEKDKEKFKLCTKLISRGAPGSSSALYAENPGMLHAKLQVNPSTFSSGDIVGVSVNGARYGRISFDKELVKKAIDAGVLIIKDNVYNTNRQYNIGEQELEAYLLEIGAVKAFEGKKLSTWVKAVK